MPKKLNSAGQMQNYVPAGNGDASGEYGDNATGSNKHFTDFKKPTKTKRGQLDNSYAFDGEIEDYNIEAFKELKKETGFSDEKTKEVQNAMIEYFGGDYEAFSKGEKQNEVKLINEALEKMSAYDGITYRGMSFKNNELFNQFANLEKNDELSMRSISSWTSEKSIAEDFGKLSAYKENDLKCDTVILICEDNKNGVGVRHISKWYGENEVLYPSTSKFKVVKKEISSKYDYAVDVLKKSNNSFTGLYLDDLEKKKSELSKYNICYIYVKEV